MLGKTQHCVFMDYWRRRLTPLNMPTSCGCITDDLQIVGTLE